jgi:transposase
MGKFIVFEGSGDALTYSIDETKIEQEAVLDGCYVIYTDVSPEDITAVEAVQSYKSLIQVEQAFSNLKTVRLEIRPIYHRTDERIKSHVFICMLAYYIMWHMKQRLQPLFEEDGAGTQRKYTFDYVIENLKSIRKETVEFCNATTNVITELTEEQKRIFQLLSIKL